MKTKITILIFFAWILHACEDDKTDSIPKLLDDNPKVSLISVPTPTGHNDIKIEYQGELISSISSLGDSINFYYINEQLDSARRYRGCTDGICDFEQSIKFIRSNQSIIQTIFKYVEFVDDSLIISSDSILMKYVYNEDRLVAIKAPYHVDTLIYKDDEIERIETYTLYGAPIYGYGSLISRWITLSSIKRPNPFYLVFERLGFPYFSSMTGVRSHNGLDCHQFCVSEYEYYNNDYGSNSGRLEYDYDSMGRIKSMNNSDSPEIKHFFKYQ